MKLDLDFFELVVLDQCFKDPSYFASIVDIATPRYFGNQDCRKVFSLLKLFYEKRGRLPSDVEIQAYLVNEPLKLAFKGVKSAMVNFTGMYKEDELLENTELFLKERGIVMALEDVVNSYKTMNIKEQSHEILEIFNKVCNITLTPNMGMDYFKEVGDFADSLDAEDDHISTGYPWLDKKLGGGFRKSGKALYVFSGAPNSGKSIVLGNVAVSLLKQGKNVVLISLEMSEQVYAKRISAQLSRIPIGTLRTSKETLVQYCNQFQKEHKSNLFIKEFPNNTIKAGGIENYINTLIKRTGVTPDAIVIDYLNLVAPTHSTGNPYQDVKSTCEDIRKLSYTFKCPVITATQLNRSAIGKENPGLETTSESIGTAATADVQVAIYSNENDREIGMMYFGIQRNRYGQNFGTKALKVDWDTLYLEQFEDDADDGDDSTPDTLTDIEGSLKSLSFI